MDTPSSTTPTATALADKAAQSADAAIQTARQKAHTAMDGLSSKMKTVKDQASEQLERFRPQLDAVSNYAKEEPGKALLMSAAVGAGLMGLVALMVRTGGPRLPSTDSLRRAAADAAESVRRVALDSIDKVRKAAGDSADEARKAAAEKADDMRKSALARAQDVADDLGAQAKGRAKAAYDSLSDTMEKWRDQAQPLVDKVKPQLDQVMDYAKDDPGKALLLAAAAGAALMGLMSTLTR
jgi:ElaB/YqjD/DUF883 family membrane-anchored ribosome-binding protein